MSNRDALIQDLVIANRILAREEVVDAYGPRQRPSPEGRRNPRNRAAGLDRLILPAMQQAKQPFWVRLLLLAWLTLNVGKDAGNQTARLAHLDDGNDRPILIQGDAGPAQVVRLGHRGTPS